MIGFKLDGRPLPDGTVGDSLLGKFLGGSSRFGKLVRRRVGGGQPGLSLSDLAAQFLQLDLRCLIDLRGRSRRHEGTGLKASVSAVSATVPDAQRPAELECRQCLGWRATKAVCSLVAALANSMEHVGDFARQHLLRREPSQQVIGRLARRRLVDA